MNTLLHPLNNGHATLLVSALLFAVAPLAAQEAAGDGWPVSFTTEGDRIQVYTPQPEQIDGDHFTARFAISWQEAKAKEPLFGAVWGDGVLELDRTTRLGKLTGFTVTDIRFPSAANVDRERITTLLNAGLVENAPPIAIDWLIAALEQEQQGVDTYANDPPEIIYREKAGVLLFIDGAPRYEKVAPSSISDKGGDPNYATTTKSLERVVNTPFLLVRRNNKEHFLYGSGMWFTTPSLKEAWTRTFNVSPDLEALAREVEEGSTPQALGDGSTSAPEIIVRTTPAILLDLKGKPDFQPISGTALLHATNTDEDLFLEVGSQDHYLLASGRWFATRDLQKGPWRYVPSELLPSEFTKIPEGSAKDAALAHIPGTAAAREAVRDAQIPQTAKVDRRTATVDVLYDGNPTFERIPGTGVEQALNANVTVLRINGNYHALDDAVWFQSPTPDGPWTVSTDVPAEVNTIPPSSAAYNTRYVHVYDHTPDHVYMGYTPGYVGSFVQGGVLIHGTGFYYDPWPNRWFPRPFTWGFGFNYDPWVGWGWGGGWGWNWYYPRWYGGGLFGGWYGGFNCGYGWWGPVGYYPAVVSNRQYQYGHRTSLGSEARSEAQVSATRSASTDLYADRQAQGIRSARVEAGSAADRKVPASTRTTMENSARDHFTDRQGNVYRQDDVGRTEQYSEGRWQKLPEQNDRTTPNTRERTVPATTPATRTAPVQRTPSPDPRSIQQNRSRGLQRTMEYQRNRPTAAPQRRPAPRQTAPAPSRTAPSRAPSPSRSSPAPSPKAPSSPSRKR